MLDEHQRNDYVVAGHASEEGAQAATYAYLASRVARGGTVFLALLGLVLELPLLLYGIAKGDVPSQVAV